MKNLLIVVILFFHFSAMSAERVDSVRIQTGLELMWKPMQLHYLFFIGKAINLGNQRLQVNLMAGPCRGFVSGCGIEMDIFNRKDFNATIGLQYMYKSSVEDYIHEHEFGAPKYYLSKLNCATTSLKIERRFSRISSVFTRLGWMSILNNGEYSLDEPDAGLENALRADIRNGILFSLGIKLNIGSK